MEKGKISIVNSPSAILRMPAPSLLAIPLSDAKPQVAAGEVVAAGQTIAVGDNADVCAPVAAVVGELQTRPLAAADGDSALCILLHTFPPSSECERPNAAIPVVEDDESPDVVLKKFGIVGLGGAATPAGLKYRRRLRWLIVNALESDDSILCDRALLGERAPTLAADIAAVAAFLGAPKTFIALRDNAPPIADVQPPTETRRFRPDYALGAERMLIGELCATDIPPSAAPSDYGALCFNLGTALAMADMLKLGEPMTSRTLTVRANDIVLNIRAPFGASAADVAAFAGIAMKEDGGEIAAGGRDGRAILSPDAVVCAKTNAMDFFPPAANAARPCIRCGDCVPACPRGLSPMNLLARWRGGDVVGMQTRDSLDACLLCRRCDEVCPSDIPLTAAFAAARRRQRLDEEKQNLAARRRARHQGHLRRQSQPPSMSEVSPATLAARARRRMQKTLKTLP